MNSEKLTNHWSINWVQFKNPHCYLCLHGPVVVCWFITQEVRGSNTPFFANIISRFCWFFRIHLGKLYCHQHNWLLDKCLEFSSWVCTEMHPLLEFHASSLLSKCFSLNIIFCLDLIFRQILILKSGSEISQGVFSIVGPSGHEPIF